NLQGRISPQLTNLTSVTWDDVGFDVNAFINLPGIVGLNANLYAARLGLMRAEVALPLIVREQRIELYRLFRQYARLQENENFLTFQEEQAALWEEVDIFQAARQMEEIRRLQR